MSKILELTDAGLYCPPGDFYIDPWRPVPRAVITHAHGDHARWGSERYLTAIDGVEVLRTRLGDEANIEGREYGQAESHNGVKISFHPAGHILGSSQIRVEHAGEVAVVSGDYKLQPDLTCRPFEPVRCNLFITESTFGLPIYRWRPPAEIFSEINAWWRHNQTLNRTSVIYVYALGKAQRVLAGVDHSIGPIMLHGAVERLVHAYQRSGISLPNAPRVTTELAKQHQGRALIIAPPSADGTPWLRKFGDISSAIASGWMQIRGTRRRRSADRGFALSDHADWDGLQQAIAATGAEEVWVTHGYSAILARWLTERGLDARPLATPFHGETPDAKDDAELVSEVQKADDS
jgi:putative mRNA 3-end processing factor